MDRYGLADFLRRRRAVLQPDDVGLGPGRRRRTPGLRREEVASLAHMSTDFYTRLEQRRGSRPSEQTVAAIARALRLTLDERDHLLALAGYTPPARGRRSDHVSPAVMRVLDTIDAPAQVVNDLGVTLRQNPLCEALLGVQTAFAGPRRSLYYRWFTEPEHERSRWPAADHELHSRRYVAALRAVHATGDVEARELVETLLGLSDEFTRYWDEHEVALPNTTHKVVAHPAVGEIELDCQILTAENQMERLVVFTVTPGTEDAERLALLEVIGTQTFA